MRRLKESGMHPVEQVIARVIPRVMVLFKKIGSECGTIFPDFHVHLHSPYHLFLVDENIPPCHHLRPPSLLRPPPSQYSYLAPEGGNTP